MEGRPRAPAGGTDEDEQVAESWIKPSSSGHLVPQRHKTSGKKAKAAAKADPRSGTRRVPAQGGLHHYFEPKPKDDDRMPPEPEPSQDAAPQPSRLVKPHSTPKSIKDKRRKSAKQLAPAGSPNRTDFDKAL